MFARVAALALPVGSITVAAAAIAYLAAQARLLPPVAAFGVFNVAMLGGGMLSLILGVIALLRAGGEEGGSRIAGALATGIGVACIGVIALLAMAARGAPPIHDITTDLVDPPFFFAAAQAPANQGRDLTYPHGSPETPELQRGAYGDLEPIVTGLPPSESYEAALAVARALGWSITFEDPAAGLFEAEAETSAFRFVDDIVVRVRGREGGSVVDVRSTSRVGVSDLGANAARIRRFAASLRADQR